MRLIREEKFALSLFCALRSKLAWEKFSQQKSRLTDRKPVTKKSVNVDAASAGPTESRRFSQALRGRK